MNTPVFSAVHTAACRPELALIQCHDSTRPDPSDDFIRSCSIPNRVLVKWQSMVDTSAQLADVPVALIMRVVNPDILVLVSSNSIGNPYHAGETAPLESSAAYCETVIRTGERLLVANALTGPGWMERSSEELKMISYLGLPILWPNRRVFGTICVLDHKENSYNVSFERVLRQFRNLIEGHLEFIYSESGVDGKSVFKSGAGREGPNVNDERLRSLVDKVADGVVVHDSSGIILEINQQACLSMGGTRERLLGKHIGTLPVHFDGDWNSRRWSETQAGDMTVVRMTRHEGNDGTRTLDTRFSCQIAQGRKMFLGLIRDITEQDGTQYPQDSHRARDAALDIMLVRQTIHWRWNVKTGELSLTTGCVDSAGRCSHLACFYLEEFLQCVHPTERSVVRRTLHEAASTGVPFNLEFRAMKADKTLLYIGCNGEPDTIGRAKGYFIGTFNDITLMKQAEDALGETHAALSHVLRWAATGELAASLVHEVNQPLGVIANYAGAIKHWLDRPEPNMREAQDAASRLTDAVVCAGSIISGLKVFARNPDLALSEVGISAAIREVLALVRHLFEQRSVCLNTKLPAEAVTACCDRTLLQQVLLNLLYNALESIDANSECLPHVWLTCERIDTEGVEISVADNGVGLNESSNAALFEPLSMDRKAEMGTGLSVCRTIVAAHGGRLWTEPRPEGGVTFRFVLPGRKPVQ
jgi:PAS domain S-box-containing protein